MALLLLSASCARTSYPAESDGAAVALMPAPQLSSAERRKMAEWQKGGTGKPLDTRKITPDKVIEAARRYLGVPHCMGGTTHRCMDCSGLLLRSFADNGITLPHSSEEQARYGRIIGQKEELRPGDLLFFIRTYKTSRFITHSGIYIGDGTFIHASTSRGVTVTRLADGWWNARFLLATRVFE